MLRRRQTRAGGEDTELRPLLSTEPDVGTEESSADVDTQHDEQFSHIMRSSVDLKQECRLILLGGDERAKRKASQFILRRNDGAHENCVNGRQVSVLQTPSYWRDHLASGFFFSRKLKTVRNELEDYISQAFPGPHAFLLVLQDDSDSRKERFLLKAIKSVFGEEALDYTIVLFINSKQNPKKARKNSCVQKCGGRHHFLEDTDQSTEELFLEIENMTAQKQRKFFIPSAYDNYMKRNFELWEDKRVSHHNQLHGEQVQMKRTNQNLMKETEDREKQHMEELEKCKDTSGVTVRELRRKLDYTELKKIFDDRGFQSTGTALVRQGSKELLIIDFSKRQRSALNAI